MISDRLRSRFGLEDRPERITKTKEELEQIAINKKKYNQSVRNSRKAKTYKPIPLKDIKKVFQVVFIEEYGELILTEQNKPIFDLISRYFAKDKSFNETNLTMNQASLNKGLLIIGKYGCGKSSMMTVFQKMGQMLMPNNFMWFTSISTLDLVDEFESADNISKEAFFKKYNNVRTIYFDDFGTESDASNYGKKNLMKEILEKRYMKRNKTFMTTNLTLLEIKTKYGNRVFSRLQEMFNIIEFGGEDYRK
ncbi:MAG: hypothetical protein QQN55_00940 [Nitrosopumilus sp.]